MKNIALLGSTGSIGRQTVEVALANPDKIKIKALVAHKSDELLEEHLLTWTPYFLELFERGAQHPLYKGAARLAAATLTDWQERFELEPPAINLHRRD